VVNPDDAAMLIFNGAQQLRSRIGWALITGSSGKE
jgi:hypothetical protein